MRTTLTLDHDVFEAAQALSRASGTTLGKVLSQLARRGLRSHATLAADAPTRNGLPLFKVSPNAAVIPSGRAALLLADELE